MIESKELPGTTPSQSTVVVIGAGIIGLTSALSIQSALCSTHDVLIVAREWPHAVAGIDASTTSANYASMWAGAHVRPIPVNGDAQLNRESRWLKQTCQHFSKQLKAEPWCGLTALRGREYLEAPPEGYVRQTAESFTSETGLPGYRRLSERELPDGVKVGFEYDTYCVNSPLYCANLLKKFMLRGGRTLQRHLTTEAEGFAVCDNVKLVVNASGFGFGDPACFPTRGQTALTNLTGINETITRQNADGTWSFAIPRFFGGGTIIGGTKEPESWDPVPSLPTRAQLLQAAQGLQPGILEKTESNEESRQAEQPLRVIADIVGRRPTRRGGMRIECEPSRSSANGIIVHAYGAGGRGFEISWGVATEVTELVVKQLGSITGVRRTDETGDAIVKARL